MRHLWAIVTKEFIQVIRDIPGLIILFLMPMVLILAVTGTQENAFKELYDNKSDMLFIDNDHEYLSKTIEDGLNKSGYFMLSKKLTVNHWISIRHRTRSPTEITRSDSDQ